MSAAGRMFEIRREAIVKEPHEMTDEELASTWVVRQPGPWHYYIDGAEVTKAEYWAAYLGRPA